MFVELHIIQNFSPANLNRDDTGAPKDCTFGGFRRARISSQCIKRSVRSHPSFEEAVLASKGDVGVRTKRLCSELSSKLIELGHSPEDSNRVAENLIKGAGFKLKDKQKTEYLLYLGRNEINALAQIAHTNWDLLTVVQSVESEKETDKKKSKKEQKEAIPKELQNEITAVFGQSFAADIALFGRMVADDGNKKVNAACQVAHAISTNEVQMEMDYYTAIDDLLPNEETGSDMIGTVEFNSSCFYRYSQINLGVLKANLQNDAEMVCGAVRGFLEASVLAIPTGKQNSMAAQNPPSYIRVLVRDKNAPWSLANAFLQPVKPGRQELEDLVTRSVEKLRSYFEKLEKMYGKKGILLDLTSSLLPELENQSLPLEELLDQVTSKLRELETTL